MKKLLKFLLAGLLLAGCSSNEVPAKEDYKVLCPSGAPTLAFLSSYESIAEKGQFDVTEGTDQLIAELSKSDSEYDIIVAPVNLGTKLISAGKSEYRLDGILTWGNLYIVGTENALSGEGDLLLFGEGAVPAAVFQASNIETSLTPKFLGEASLVSADLVSGKANAGLLAEPVASATIAKAKKQGIALSVLVDVQEAYRIAQGSEAYGYPQAAVFVKKGTDISNLTTAISEFTEAGMPDAAALLETIGVDTLGLPDASVVAASLEKQNVHYKKAADVEEQLTTFLKVFGIEYSKDMLNE